MTNVQMARAFEAALRLAGRRVEATYYDGGSHNGLFPSAAQHDAELQGLVAFLRRQLSN